MFVNN